MLQVVHGKYLNINIDTELLGCISVARRAPGTHPIPALDSASTYKPSAFYPFYSSRMAYKDEILSSDS